MVSNRSFVISGGEVVSLPVAKGGALPSENEDIKIEVAGFLMDGAKKELTYTFGFSLKSEASITSVRIEDVSDTTSELMVNDVKPKSGKYWKGYSVPKTIADKNLRWILVDADSVRIYRFTITTSTGTKHVMYQASLYPGASKQLLRRIL